MKETSHIPLDLQKIHSVHTGNVTVTNCLPTESKEVSFDKSLKEKSNSCN